MPGVHVSTTVNGDRLDFVCEPEETLLDCLRDRLGLTGAKEGCGTGDCGACSVILDGRLVCSCLVLGVEAADREIETVEGLADGDDLHPLQGGKAPRGDPTGDRSAPVAPRHDDAPSRSCVYGKVRALGDDQC